MTTPRRILHALGVGFLELVLRSIPPEALVRAAGAAGALAYRLDRRRREIALENLRLVFEGTKTAAERERIARASFRHFGRALAELVFVDRLFAGRLGRPAGREFLHSAKGRALSAAIEAGPGLLLTAHLGSWEVGAYVLRTIGMPLRVVARTLDARAADTFVTRRRGGAGVVIRKQGAARGVLRAVESGCWVAILADQNAGRHGVFVPFFGIPAATTPLPGVLHHRRDTALFAGCCLPVSGSLRRYDLLVERVAPPPPGLPEHEHVRIVLERLHAIFERWIRAHPEQYVWSHRRFKTRPVDEPPGPRTPAYGRKRPALRPRERAARATASEGTGT